MMLRNFVHFIMAVFFLTILWQTAAHSCLPRPNDHESVHCFQLVGQTSDFCQANEMCATHMYLQPRLSCFLAGLSLYPYMGGPQQSEFYWTSVNNFMRQDMNQNSWLDAEALEFGGRSFELNDRLKTNQTSVIYGRASSLYFAQEPMKFNLSVYCEVIEVMNYSTLITSQKYGWVTDWHPNEAASKLDTFPRCLSKQIVRSALLCTFKCTTNSQCKSAYYNQVTHQCIIALYVDTLLPFSEMGDPANWQRYARLQTVN
ncbi:hypothetical protein PHET_00795 [Paragonimus heterotremus]|uniref:Apple domain-containing protein n=1 Tax=Paragonimus heterotremus TaxID=100268 RepID=A0A8J4WJN8_9TREM|nr:hypothetical protein PHET_00795 [Paragonimus heterotremus]